MKVMTAALVALLGVSTVSAKDFNQVSTYGVGTQSCGAWAAARKNPNSSEAFINLAWVMGYLSAASALTQWDYERTDMEGINAFMDNYCAANPVKDMMYGALALAAELKKKGQ